MSNPDDPTPTPRHKFRIEPLLSTNQTDMLAAAQLAESAFDSENSPFQRTYLVHPFPSSQDRAEGTARRLAHGLSPKKGGKVGWKAVLDNPGGEKDGELAGLSVWQPPGVGYTVFKSTDKEELGEEERGLYKNVDLDGWNRLFGVMQESRKRLHGDKEHWYLELLAIHPSYQRQGLGALLLESRLSQLPRNQAVQLESTPAGQGLYRKFGFEVVETLNCKGRDKEIPIPVMIRKPEEV